MSIDPRRGEFPVPGKVYRMTSVDLEFDRSDVQYVRVEQVNPSPVGSILPRLIGTMQFTSATSSWWPHAGVYHRSLKGASVGLALQGPNYPGGFVWWREFEPVSPISAPAGGGLL